MLYFLFFYILCRKDRPICPACAEKEKRLSKQVGNGGRMDNMNGILMIGISFALILLIAAMRSRTDLLINFIMRAVLGTLAIYFINMFLGSQGFSWHVGIGPLSIVVSGFLGLPGIGLLYGINILKPIPIPPGSSPVSALAGVCLPEETEGGPAPDRYPVGRC